MSSHAHSFVLPRQPMEFPTGSWFDRWEGLDERRAAFSGSVDDFREKLRREVSDFFRRQTEAHLLDFQLCVPEERFAELQQYALPIYKPAASEEATAKLNAPDGASRNCFLTFHGTNSMDALMSIVKFGFLMPGEQHPRFGYSLSMATGNLYGDGVYTSSHPEVAGWYAWEDSDECMPLLINVLFPGNVACVTRDYHRLPHVYHKGKAQVLHPKGTPSGKLLSTPVFLGHAFGGCFRPTAEGVYDWAHNSNTLTPDYDRMWISGCSSSVVPVAIVKIRHGIATVGRPLAVRKERTLPDGTPVSSLSDKEFVLTHLFGDYYALPEFVYKNCSKKHTVRRHMIIPRSILYDKSFRTAVESHAAGTCDAHDSFYFYGSAASVGCHAKNLAATIAAEMRRERRHNAEDGIRAAMKCICGDVSKIRLEKGHTAGATVAATERTCYHIVEIVADGTTNFDDDCVDRLIKEFATPLSGLYINVKLLYSFGFGASKKEDRLSPFFRLKDAFQYEGIFENLYYDAAKMSWAEAIEMIEEELQNIGASSTEAYIGDFSVEPVTLSCEERIGDGFVTSLDGYPMPIGSFSSRVVFKGTPTFFTVDDQFYTATVRKFHHNRSDAAVKSSVAASGPRAHYEGSLRHRSDSAAAQLVQCAVKAHGKSIEADVAEAVTVTADEVRREAVRVMNRNCGVLTSFLSRLRNSIAAGGRDRMRLFHTHIEHVAKEIAAIARHPLTDLRVGRTLLQATASIVGDISTLTSCPFSGAWYAGFERMRFARKIMRRVKETNAAEEAVGAMCEGEVEEALESLRTCGVGIRVLRSDASQVEPWLTVVQYISPPTRQLIESEASVISDEALFDVGDMFRASQLEEEQVDRFGEVVTDVLVPPNLASHSLERLYTAYVITRNPFLCIPTQAIALRSICWVKAAESVLMRCRGAPAHLPADDFLLVRELVGLAVSLGKSLHSYFSKPTVTQSPEPNTVASLCELLARNIQFGGEACDALPSEGRFDLLAESLVRTVHSYAKSVKKSEQELLLWLLGIDKEGALVDENFAATFSVDVERSARRSSKLLRFSYNNCSPFAVVAVLGLLDHLRQASSAKQIVDAFQSKQISMKGFLQEYERSKGQSLWPAKATQVALFVYAIRSHSSQARASFSSACQQPQQYITHTVNDLLEAFARRRKAVAAFSAFLKARAARRAAVLSERIMECAENHTVARSFSAEEVAAMNESGQRHRNCAANERAVVVPYELVPKSGLLKHHCCYPSCTQYLQCFATASDIARNERHGVMHHLRFNAAANNYVPGFHVAARHHCRCDFKQFVERMDEHFRHCKKYKALVNRMEHLTAAWEHYNHPNQQQSKR